MVAFGGVTSWQFCGQYFLDNFMVNFMGNIMDNYMDNFMDNFDDNFVDNLEDNFLVTSHGNFSWTIFMDTFYGLISWTLFMALFKDNFLDNFFTHPHLKTTVTTCKRRRSVVCKALIAWIMTHKLLLPSLPRSLQSCQSRYTHGILILVKE